MYITYITPIWMLIGDDDDMVFLRLQELHGQHLCHRTRDRKGPMTASDRFDDQTSGSSWCHYMT